MRATVAHEDLLTTREQRYKARHRDKMFVSRAAITSAAFLSLRTAVACQVYLIFLSKCRWEKAQIRPGTRDKASVLANNGEIRFTYKEAETQWGIRGGKFRRAIDELLRVGLIDISHSGFGLYKDATLYSISERWRDFGTGQFVVEGRAKRDAHIGFAVGNTFGRNCNQGKSQHAELTVDQQSSATGVGFCDPRGGRFIASSPSEPCLPRTPWTLPAKPHVQRMRVLPVDFPTLQLPLMSMNGPVAFRTVPQARERQRTNDVPESI